MQYFINVDRLSLICVSFISTYINKMLARRANRKGRKKQKHEATQARKSREYVRHVGTYAA